MIDLSVIPTKQTDDTVTAAEFNLIVNAIRELQPKPVLATSALTKGLTNQTSILLNWTAVQNATAYMLKEGDNVLYNGPALSFTHTNLQPGSDHNYTLTASAAGYVSSTASLGAETLPLPQLPDPEVTITNTTKFGFRINTSQVPSATVYVYKVNGVTVHTGNELYFDVTGKVPATMYGVTVTAQANGYLDSDQVATTATTLAYVVKYGWVDADPYNGLQAADNIAYQKTADVSDVNADLVLDFHDMPSYKYPVICVPSDVQVFNFFTDSGSSFNNDNIPGDHYRPAYLLRGTNYYSTYSGEVYSTGPNDRITFKKQ